MTYHIRTAVMSERAALEALQTRASLANPGDREAILANLDAIELPEAQIAAGHVFVMEDGGTVQGFAAILPREDGDIELDGLFVEPSAWRRGMGLLLVEHCKKIARAYGAVALHVTGNPHAEQFYAACGFRSNGTVKLRFGVGQLMRATL